MRQATSTIHSTPIQAHTTTNDHHSHPLDVILVMLLCLYGLYSGGNVPRERRRKATKEEGWVVRRAGPLLSPTQKGQAAAARTRSRIEDFELRGK